MANFFRHFMIHFYLDYDFSGTVSLRCCPLSCVSFVVCALRGDNCMSTNKYVLCVRRMADI